MKLQELFEHVGMSCEQIMAATGRRPRIKEDVLVIPKEPNSRPLCLICGSAVGHCRMIRPEQRKPYGTLL